MNIFPIEVRNKNIEVAPKISRDVTAVKKREAQFIQAQKMEVVGLLASGVVHDFNNFLSVILSCAGLMQKKLGPSDPMQNKVKIILQAAQHASELTRQLMTFSQKERGLSTILDINDILKNLDKMLRQVINGNIELSVVCTPQLGYIEAVASQIGQVILNLVINARDAMPSGGKLSIKTNNAVVDADFARAHVGISPGNYVLITVSDTGMGMTNEVRARLFEPLFTTKSKGKGTGLGLATCDFIVKQFGGYIFASSEPSRGAVFEVYFPEALGPLMAFLPLSHGENSVKAKPTN